MLIFDIILFQAKMADAMIEIFGSKLVVNAVDENEISHPSPESLLNKIIVKGKKKFIE